MLPHLIIGALMIGSVYGIVGIGYGLIYKSSGLMSLCQGDMLMFGGFIGLSFYKSLSLPFPLALLMTMLVMFCLGVGIQKVLITPLLKKGAPVAYVILCTVSVSMILQNAAMLGWGSKTFQFPPIFSASTVKFGGVNVAPESLLVLVTALLCMVALHMFLRYTRFGTAVRAAAMDEKAASALGINVPWTKSVAWGLAAGLAGSIGACLGPVFGVYTAMGILTGQKGFAGAVAGGYGNIYGAMIGGLFFGFLETFVSAYLTSAYKDFISFGMLFVIMIFMPTGLFREQVLE